MVGGSRKRLRMVRTTSAFYTPEERRRIDAYDQLFALIELYNQRATRVPGQKEEN